MPITIKVVRLNPSHGEEYSIKHYVIKFVSGLRRSVALLWFSGFLCQPPLIFQLDRLDFKDEIRWGKVLLIG
jgi:hypothetical protein